MDADVRITQKFEDNLSCSFCVNVKGLSNIALSDKNQRDHVRWNLTSSFGCIYGPNCTIDILFEDECPACGQELKDGKCPDPTCHMNYEPDDPEKKDLKETGSGV